MHTAPRSLLVLLTLGSGMGVAGAVDPPGTSGFSSAPSAAQATAQTQADSRRMPARIALLDLKLGDASRYFPPGELATPIDERLEEIIVNGRRVEPIRDGRNVPLGLFPSLKHAATHPLDAWRVFAPLPDFKIPDRSVDDPKEPPGAYRGRILEPGAIYD